MKRAVTRLKSFLRRLQDALDLIVSAIDKAGYTGKVKIGLDVAASEFFTGEAV